MRPHTRYARSGDAYIAYQVVGEGPVDVLLLPHFFQHLELWWEDRHRASFTRALAELARVILFDKRGTGLSDRTCGVPPFDVQMDDLRAVLDAAGSERSVLWAGGDATPMILLFAATFPQRAFGLVLWDPFPTYIRTADMPWLMTRAEFDDAVAGTAKSLEDPSATGLRDRMPTIGSDDDLRAFWRVSRLGTSPGDHLAFTRVLAETDVRHVLPTIRVPTLVLSNEALADRHATTRYVAERIPTARLAIVPGRDASMFVGDTQPLVDEVRAFLAEVRDMPPEGPDRVLATVLFTDIVGSTARAAELGDAAWRELLRAHHSRVRRELARFRGRELDTAGDGFFATFDGPARGIRCACAVRDSVRELGLEVRAGLHAGECELLDEKVTGIAVNIGARVASLAQPGEVLVSSTVKDLVAGSGLSFSDRGEAELKGAPGSWRLFAVEPGEL
ncbi:MAG: adenylate/guanylate cyclase domain-containing protein [Thermoleophilia bacterium]|nr:adenylate/guanylate cyclase domain-containing protein [Thermoleophilia bacterium]